MNLGTPLGGRLAEPEPSKSIPADREAANGNRGQVNCG
jgi:hypothetical protein